MSVCSSRERNRLAHDAEGRVACLLLGSSWYADISSRTRYKRLCDVRVSVCVCVCVCACKKRRTGGGLVYECDPTTRSREMD